MDHSKPLDSIEQAEAEIATELVRRIAARDERAEGELVRHYSRGLRFLLRRLTRDPELAQEISQDTFRIVIERLRGAGLKEPAGLVGFVHGTARNLILNERRKIARRRTDTVLDANDEPPATETPEPPNQLDKLLREEKATLVRRLVGELRVERDRQILYRTYLAEESRDGICADLKLDKAHFDRVLYRARQRLKELLEEHFAKRNAK